MADAVCLETQLHGGPAPVLPVLRFGPDGRVLSLFDGRNGWSGAGDCHCIAPRSFQLRGDPVWTGVAATALLDRVRTGRAACDLDRSALRQALDAFARCTGIARASLPGSEDLGAAIRAADAGGVLTLSESSEIAIAAAEQLWPGFAAGGGSLWCIKEGHTCSVWRAEPPPSCLAAPCCLLVPRDYLADAELQDSADRLSELARNAPLAIVAELARVPVDHGGGRFCVVCCDWIDEARELHLIATPAGPRLMAVEQFAAGFQPVGAILPQQFSDDALAAMRALVRHSIRQEPCGWRMTTFEINDGDFVLDGQGGLVAIAASAEPDPGSLVEVVQRYAGFGGTCAVSGKRIATAPPAQLAAELKSLAAIDWSQAARHILARARARSAEAELARVLLRTDR